MFAIITQGSYLKLWLQAGFAMTPVQFCCVEEFSKRHSGKACLLWPDSDWNILTAFCECTSVCFSIFAHVHRLHFFSLVESVTVVWWLKSLPREVGVMKITWENVLSRAGCAAGRKVWWSTSRNSHSVNLLPLCRHDVTPLTAICISASVRPFPDQKHTSTNTHTQETARAAPK